MDNNLFIKEQNKVEMSDLYLKAAICEMYRTAAINECETIGDLFKVIKICSTPIAKVTSVPICINEHIEVAEAYIYY